MGATSTLTAMSISGSSSCFDSSSIDTTLQFAKHNSTPSLLFDDKQFRWVTSCCSLASVQLIVLGQPLADKAQDWNAGKA
jgi:hypothetical protein